MAMNSSFDSRPVSFSESKSTLLSSREEARRFPSTGVSPVFPRCLLLTSGKNRVFSTGSNNSGIEWFYWFLFKKYIFLSCNPCRVGKAIGKGQQARRNFVDSRHLQTLGRYIHSFRFSPEMIDAAWKCFDHYARRPWKQICAPPAKAPHGPLMGCSCRKWSIEKFPRS